MENIWITLIQSICTLLGVYFTTRQGAKKGNKALEEQVMKIDKKVDGLKEDNEEQHRDILRLTLYEENLPIAERIIAGDRYLKKGGNGDAKKYYMTMLAEHTK